MNRPVPMMSVLIFFIITATAYVASTTDHRLRVHRSRREGAPESKVTLLAFGDVNLGRTLGQSLLHEGPEYVFRRFTLDTADIVFVNLESTLSEQHGETESPVNNIIFTGPPIGAQALARAGITLAATANNHAYDYGERAMLETIERLDAANIAHAGTAKHGAYAYEPLCLERNGLKLAFFAVTDLMNQGWHWRQHTATTDTMLLFPKLREASSEVDAVIVSVHGGDEYAETPSVRIEAFARQCIAQGARLVLGHHPHVPYGIDSVQGGYIVASLGNFIFHQPQAEWAQKSYGVMFEFSKADSGVSLKLKRIVPIDVGFQPERARSDGDREQIFMRAQRFSTISLAPFH